MNGRKCGRMDLCTPTMMLPPGRGSLKPDDIMAFRKAVYLVWPKHATCANRTPSDSVFWGTLQCSSLKCTTFFFFYTTFALLFSVWPKESSHWTSREPVFVKGKPQWRSTKGLTDRNEILKIYIYTNSPFQSVSWPVLTDVWTSQKHDHKRNHFVPNKLYPLFSSFTMKLIWLKI